MVEKNIQKGQLRVWWIPQVPMNAFHVLVDDTKNARNVLTVLADYDLFQLKNNIKPEYSNTGGLEEFDGKEWTEWYNEEGENIDEIYSTST